MKPKTKKAIVRTKEPVLHHQIGDLHDGDIVDVPIDMNFDAETIFFPVDEVKETKKIKKSDINPAE